MNPIMHTQSNRPHAKWSQFVLVLMYLFPVIESVRTVKPELLQQLATRREEWFPSFSFVEFFTFITNSKGTEQFFTVLVQGIGNLISSSVVFLFTPITMYSIAIIAFIGTAIVYQRSLKGNKHPWYRIRLRHFTMALILLLVLPMIAHLVYSVVVH
ncbi:hypothetical protein PTI45_04503 [Paenibacillus nuruki]|uniref:Uncharacterized protein n=1 Tax=Paenibacillus nuruki TaxID=1886670 RepID=A0A1E3KXX0_9BACL|nr:MULTISPECIES: hypothetical protein [Paenibacillus]ODP26161.1 hypothetical protein PTI45_04503 [Paenibacillus nuruki]TKJ83820.1 hypothetical protein PaeCFBP13512_22125 [Paenibacillus sp. CFBP13512]